MTYEEQPRMDSKYWAARGVPQFAEIAAQEEGLSAGEVAKRVREAQRVRGKRESKQVAALIVEGMPSVAGRFAQKAARNLFRRSPQQ